MNKRFYNKIIFCLIIIILVSISSFSFIYISLDKKEDTELNVYVPSTKTIMIYMVGSNLESEYGAATSDLDEISSSLPNLNDINVVVYLGGSSYYYNNYVDADENAILNLTKDGFEDDNTFNAKNMGESETLTYFINYTTKNYKTDDYALILWDHGGGPLIGYGLDEISNDILTLNEIDEALSNTMFNNDKLDFIGFDACLMASFEVANTLEKYANYLIASEETIPGDGWNYQFLEGLSSSDDYITIGKKIIDSYFEYYESKTNLYDLTMSLFDLSKLESLNESLNYLFNDLSDNLTTNTFSQYARIRTNTKAFGGYSASTEYDLIDLYNFKQTIKFS